MQVQTRAVAWLSFPSTTCSSTCRQHTDGSALPAGPLPAEGADAALPAPHRMHCRSPPPAAEKERARDDKHRDEPAGRQLAWRATLYFVSKAALPLLPLPAPGRGGQAGVSQPGARQGCSPRSNRLAPKPKGWGAHFAWPKTTPPPRPASGVGAKLEEGTGPKIRPTCREAGELEMGHLGGILLDFPRFVREG